ncbi:MAG: DUF2232 domain-containing protein [Desulfuromonadaceae bacterium]
MLGTFGVFLAMLVPFPAAYVTMRHGVLDGVVIVVFTCAALLAMEGMEAGVPYLLQFGVASFVLPWLLQRRMAWDRAVAAATLVAVAASLLFVVGAGIKSGQSIDAMVQVYVQGELDKALLVYKQARLPAEQLRELQALANRTAEFLQLAYPALVTVGAGLLMLLTTSLLNHFARGRYLLAGIPFRLWKAPEMLVWLVILGGFGVFFGEGTLYQLAVNLLTLMLPIYFFQGLAVVAHYFHRKGVVPALRVIGYLLMVIANPLQVIVAGIGIFDLWVDFRKPRIKKS